MHLFFVLILFSIPVALGSTETSTELILFEDQYGNIYFEDYFEKEILKTYKSTEIRMFLYTRNNTQIGCEIRMASFGELQNCRFYDPTKENYFVIHGWKNSYSSEFNTVIRNAVITKADMNVFVVDWENIAKRNYLSSFYLVPTVGEIVANFINAMMASHNLSPNRFMLTGHSLGAHVAGCIGASVKGSVKYIVGLDPAGPLFTLSNTKNRLDESDASFVQVIHTSTLILGFDDPIGHTDYYPNDGIRQPGCTSDRIGGCSHSRAYKYYVESILNGGFSAVPCENYQKYRKGDCVNYRMSYLGTLDVDTSAKGVYYLDTNGVTPFSLG